MIPRTLLVLLLLRVAPPPQVSAQGGTDSWGVVARGVDYVVTPGGFKEPPGPGEGAGITVDGFAFEIYGTPGADVTVHLKLPPGFTTNAPPKTLSVSDWTFMWNNDDDWFWPEGSLSGDSVELSIGPDGTAHLYLGGALSVPDSAQRGIYTASIGISYPTGADTVVTRTVELIGARIVPITIRNGDRTIVDTFGFHPTATYCIDGEIEPGLVEVELPWIPVGIFEAKFVDHRSTGACLGIGLSTHIQETGKADTFRLEFRPGDAGYSFTFSWPAGLDSIFEFLTIWPPTTFMDFPVDMLAETTFQVSNPAISVLDIIGRLRDSLPTGVEAGKLPTRVSLFQNYPNPFNPATTIRYHVPRRDHVRLSVFNALGQEVAILRSRVEEAGEQSVVFDASHHSSGVYFYRLRVGSTVETRKMVVIR